MSVASGRSSRSARWRAKADLPVPGGPANRSEKRRSPLAASRSARSASAERGPPARGPSGRADRRGRRAPPPPAARCRGGRRRPRPARGRARTGGRRSGRGAAGNGRPSPPPGAAPPPRRSHHVGEDGEVARGDVERAVPRRGRDRGLDRGGEPVHRRVDLAVAMVRPLAPAPPTARRRDHLPVGVPHRLGQQRLVHRLQPVDRRLHDERERRAQAEGVGHVHEEGQDVLGNEGGRADVEHGAVPWRVDRGGGTERARVRRGGGAAAWRG